MKKENLWITGGRGMVGRNLKDHKKSREYKIISPSRKELDLTKENEVIAFLGDNQIDTVIHCAGRVGGIQANINNPVEFLLDNTKISFNVISASAQQRIKNFINVGSSCMYPITAENPLKEEYLGTGKFEPTNEGYAIAKFSSQRLCSYLDKAHSAFNYKTIVPCNIYGKYDNFDPVSAHLLPSIIRKVHESKSKVDKVIEIWGDGSVRREFMFAEDLSDAIWFCLENIERLPNTSNVGLGYDFSIAEYYSIVADVLDVECTYKYNLSKPVGMQRKLVDNTVLKKLGWSSSTNIKEGIKKTYSYYLSH